MANTALDHGRVPERHVGEFAEDAPLIAHGIREAVLVLSWETAGSVVSGRYLTPADARPRIAGSCGNEDVATLAAQLGHMPHATPSKPG